MSLLNIKQIAGPGVGGRAPTGAIPVFDGNRVRWSNNATTALQLPTGTAAQRPTGIAGLIRYNTDAAKLEAFENGVWNNVINPIKSFLDLADAPKTYSGYTGKVLAVNAAGTGIEYIDPTVTIDKIKGTTNAQAGQYVTVKGDGTGLQYSPLPALGNVKQYKFRFDYTSSAVDANKPPSEVPAGWTVTVLSGTQIQVDHNMGQPPTGGMFLGYSTTADTYYARAVAGNANYSYQPATMSSRFVLNGLGPSNTQGTANGHVYFVVYFLV